MKETQNKSELILYQTEDGKTRQTACTEFLHVQNRGNRKVLCSIKFFINTLAFLENIAYTLTSIPAAPLPKGTRNPVGFCFLGGFSI